VLFPFTKLESILTKNYTLWRERPNSAVGGRPKLCNSDDVSVRDPHCKVMLSGRTSHTCVESISFFVPDWICRVDMVI